MTQKIRPYAFLSLMYLSPRFLCLFLRAHHQEVTSFYWRLSEGILRYGRFGEKGARTTAFEPLYPFFLATARWMTGDQKFLVLSVQIVIGAIGCLYLYELGAWLSRNKKIGFMSALLYSFYPYLIYQSVMISEITLLTTVLIVSVYYYCKVTSPSPLPSPKGRGNDNSFPPLPLKGGEDKGEGVNSILCGIFFGLTILTRTTAMPILFLGIIALLVKKFYRQALLLFVTSTLVILPMIIRNYQIDGSLLLTRSGENLFDGNLEYSDKLIPAYSVDVLKPYVYGILRKERRDLIRSSSNKELDRFFTQKAFEFMSEHPWRTLRLKLKNIIDLFNFRLVPFYPMTESSELILDGAGGLRVEPIVNRSIALELAHSLSYGFIFLTAAAGIYLRRKEFQTDLILYLTILSFIAVYSLYFPTTRLRAPMDFVLMFFSACAIETFLRRFKNVT